MAEQPTYVNHQSSPDINSSPEPTNNETEKKNSEDPELAEVKNTDSAEEKKGCPTEKSSSDKDSSRISEVNPPQTDDGGRGEGIREISRDEQLSMTGKKHTEEKAAPEAATSQGDSKVEEVDGHKAGCDEESTVNDNTSTEAQEDGKSILENDLAPEEEEREKQEGVTTSSQTALPPKISEEEEICERRKEVETIGPTPQETPEPPGILGGNRRFLIVVGVVVLAILMQHLFHTESPPQKSDEKQIGIFLGQMEKLKTQFPNQRAELWKRSRIHLLRHLQTAQPTEPVSLILTAGVRAEKTLHCLAQGLASAFSSALNSSVLHIDGVSKASQDSDQVKLDIDSSLRGAFEGDKSVAVIHRFEQLPPGSTLIFYRYCDHENAAYKKTCLIFTVLLDEEDEIPAMSRLSTVEEMVDDHLQRKFLSGSHPVSYDRMDLDKYGGLWSRISHLILPVVAEERIEHEGC